MRDVEALAGGKMSSNALGSKSIQSRGSMYAVLVELGYIYAWRTRPRSHPQILRRPVLTEYVMLLVRGWRFRLVAVYLHEQLVAKMII
jgi:hypothetical protein